MLALQKKYIFLALVIIIIIIILPKLFKYVNISQHKFLTNALVLNSVSLFKKYVFIYLFICLFI